MCFGDVWERDWKGKRVDKSVGYGRGSVLSDEHDSEEEKKGWEIEERVDLEDM